jgi:hypothetical protein
VKSSVGEPPDDPPPGENLPGPADGGLVGQQVSAGHPVVNGGQGPEGGLLLELDEEEEDEPPLCELDEEEEPPCDELEDEDELLDDEMELLDPEAELLELDDELEDGTCDELELLLELDDGGKYSLELLDEVLELEVIAKSFLTDRREMPPKRRVHQETDVHSD